MIRNERLENPRYELVNGEEHMMTQPSTKHNRIALNLSSILHSYLRGKRCKPFGEMEDAHRKGKSHAKALLQGFSL